MSQRVEITANGRPLQVEAMITVASALLNAGEVCFRRSTSGMERGPLCGMGVCQECRVTIDGAPHQRACMTLVAAGMRVDTEHA